MASASQRPKMTQASLQRMKRGGNRFWPVLL
jgi:hypothetical protein